MASTFATSVKEHLTRTWRRLFPPLQLIMIGACTGRGLPKNTYEPLLVSALTTLEKLIHFSEAMDHVDSIHIRWPF
jgi:hypothetical protein